MYFIFYKDEQIYVNEYKNRILPILIKAIDPNLTYNSINNKKDEFQKLYQFSNFDRKPNSLEKIQFYANDHIEGYLNNTIYTWITNIRSIYKSGRSFEEPIFNGMFTITNCNKDIKTYIKISKNIQVFDKQQNLEMDSQEFEKYFDIYSENKILSVRILTHDIMELLVNFYNKYNLKFEIVLKNNFIFIRFHTDSIFEPQLFKNNLTLPNLFIYYSILEFIINITTKINSILNELEV